MEYYKDQTAVWRDVDLEGNDVDLTNSDDELIVQFRSVTRELETLVSKLHGRIETMTENEAEATALHWTLEHVFPFRNGSAMAAVREFLASRGINNLRI